MIRKIFAIILFLGFTGLVRADLLCVGPNSSGDGLGGDWNNIMDWDTLTFARGNTYFLKSGTYTARSITTPMSGTSLITIKKAADGVGNHGSETGWVNNSSNFGLGQAVLNGSFSIENTGYITFDGSYAYGLKTIYSINLSTTITRSVGISISGNSNFPRPGITFKYLESAGPAGPDPYPYHQHTTINLYAGIWYYDGQYHPVDIPGLTISHCDFHGSCTLMQAAAIHGAVIEYSKWHDSTIADWKSVDDHPNVLYIQNSNDVIYRYNEMWNWDTEGLYPVYSTYRWKIYGNIFRDPTPGTGNPRAIQPQASQGNSTQPGGLEIYNNTFANLRYASVYELQILTEGATVYNNIFYNSPAPSLNAPKVRQSNNLINPATNPLDASLRPKSGSAAIDAGKTLMSDGFINVDADGHQRGYGSGWDIGAFESVGGTPPPQGSTYHPADTDENSALTQDEVTIFGNCWKTSCKAEATADNASWAGTLYVNSALGKYKYNTNKSCPQCWEAVP